MRHHIPLLFLAISTALAGCDAGPWATVTGTVHLEDQPLEKGIVTFHPDEGGAAAYGQVTNGAFTLMTGSKSGLKPGAYKITVIEQTIPKMGTDETAKLLTPAQYASPETSTLSAVITPGPNVVPLVLKK